MLNAFSGLLCEVHPHCQQIASSATIVNLQRLTSPIQGLCLLLQDMADADKDRVAKVKASLPPVPKQAKQAKSASEPKAEKAPRAKSAYMVSLVKCVICATCILHTDNFAALHCSLLC